MGALETDLLEAIPAPARYILLVGAALASHQPAWEARNPRVVIEIRSGPVPAGGAKADAALLDADAAGGALAETVKTIAARLAATGTLALLTLSAGKVASLEKLLVRSGFSLERSLGGGAAGHALVRGVLSGARVPKLRINGLALSAAPDTLNEAGARVRMGEPFDQLSSLPGVRCRIAPGIDVPPAQDRTAENLLIVQRPFIFNPMEFAAKARAQNYLTIADVDDLPNLDGRAAIELQHVILGCFHAVQASTPALAAQLAPFHSEMAVFGNHLARARAVLPQRSGQPVRILFAAINRQAGWGLIVDAFRAVMAAAGDRVAATIVGDREFHDRLEPLNATYRPLLSHADYRQALESCDVALLPLADTAFDRSKTDLKFIECAEAGATVLASHVVYGDTVRSGETGLLYGDADEFRSHLQTLIDDPAQRIRLAGNALRYVRENRMLADHVGDRLNWYLSLAQRRTELDRLLDERLRRITGQA